MRCLSMRSSSSMPAGDGSTNIIFSVLQGCGRTRLGAVANLVIIWLCGLPLACGLAFGAHMGIAGFWWGQLAISVVMTGERACRAGAWA